MDSQTLNYAIVAVGIVITYSLGLWIISARKWFTGPVKQIACTCLHPLKFSQFYPDFIFVVEEMGINVIEPGVFEAIENKKKLNRETTY